MVVMVIMVLLAGLAVPSFTGSLRTERLRAGARIVVSAVQIARGRAVAEACFTRGEFATTRAMVAIFSVTDNWVSPSKMSVTISRSSSTCCACICAPPASRSKWSSHEDNSECRSASRVPRTA